MKKAFFDVNVRSYDISTLRDLLAVPLGIWEPNLGLLGGYNLRRVRCGEQGNWSAMKGPQKHLLSLLGARVKCFP